MSDRDIDPQFDTSALVLIRDSSVSTVAFAGSEVEASLRAPVGSP